MKKTLVILPFQQYNDVVMDLTYEMSRDASALCYVTLNKTYSSLVRKFGDEKIDADRFVFIDSITPKVLNFDDAERCTFLESLDSLDSFAETLLTLVKSHQVKHVIFDSVSSFLVYKSDEEVLKFFNYVVSFLEEMDVHLTMFVLKDDAKRPAVMQLEMQADKTRRL